jgi:hypothetical protein
VLQSTGEVQGALSCSDMVVSIWSSCLSRSVLGLQEDGQALPPGAPTELPVGRLQLVEVVEMLQVGDALHLIQMACATCLACLHQAGRCSAE